MPTWARRGADPIAGEVAVPAASVWKARPPSSRRVVARFVQFVGLVNAVLCVLPPRPHPLSPLADLMPTTGMLTARAVAGVVGVLLIYLGAGLRRGKHRAWQVAVALSALSAVLHVA